MKVKLLIISVFLFASASFAGPKPNIVHIMVDDLGWQDIAAHKIDGDTVYETPNLDRLTKMGRRFTEAYSPSPVCAPSRVSFLRGQYPANTGVYSVTGGQLPRPHQSKIPLIPPHYLYGLPVEEPMIPEVLKRAGYFSGHVGKWHAGGKHRGYPFPTDQGFDFGFLEKNGGPLIYNDSELWNPKDGRKIPLVVPGNQSSPTAWQVLPRMTQMTPFNWMRMAALTINQPNWQSGLSASIRTSPSF